MSDLEKYEAVIGMEVHVELQTASKLFCRCPAEHFQVPANEHVCPVCTSQPGSLPVVNERAVELTVMTGMALNCEVRPHSIFARKNYVYPDLPKGYQISQYELPLCTGGWAEIADGDGARRVGIERVHLEEDTGKLVHESRSSLVDYNRAGVPLMEVVSDSSLRSAEEAWAYLQKIRQLVRYLGASTGDMEKGAMRCEANISVRRRGASEYGTKVEVKNLNSFRSVRAAIDYEVGRQVEVIEAGGQVRQVTMGWDENAGFTRPQRSKEYADDYRYFPDPDLLDVDLPPEWIDRLASSLPELPDAKAARYAGDFGLPPRDAALLAGEKGTAAWFEAAVAAGGDPRQVGNWVAGPVFRRLNEQAEEGAGAEIPVGPAALVELIGLVAAGTINQNAAREVFDAVWDGGGAPAEIVEKRGLTQISDSGELEEAVDAAIAGNPEVAAKIAAGNDKPIGFLVGQVMKATRGKANPQLVQKLLRDRLLG